MRSSLPYIALGLGIAIVILILLSWIITAAMPDYAMRSLLSPEGIRWFFGHFTGNLANPFLVWLVLGTIAYGAIKESGLLFTLLHYKERIKEYPVRAGMRMVLSELIVFCIVIALLTLIPQAILLSVTGGLFPSSFSQSIVPILAFATSVMGVSYGLVSGRLHSLADVFGCLVSEFSHAGKWFLIYVLAVELYFSIGFVFQIG